MLTSLGLALVLGAAAPDVVVQILRFDPWEAARFERLRFRTTVCEAWTERREQRIFITESSVDTAWGWVIRIAPRAGGGMAATVTERGEGNSESNSLAYDVLEVVHPDGRAVTTDVGVDCKAVAEGKFIPQLRFAKTGRTFKW